MRNTPITPKRLASQPPLTGPKKKPKIIAALARPVMPPRIASGDAREIVVAVGRSGDHAACTVQDRGAGIPDEFRDRIFERFTQADSSNKRRTGGTGLGLSISAAIVDAHRGELDFESKVGEGTTFFFALRKA